MDNSPVASGPRFRICPLCEESKLVFAGLYEARCPVCDHEPDEDFLRTLRQIVDLPEVEISRTRTNGAPKPEGEK